MFAIRTLSVDARKIFLLVTLCLAGVGAHAVSEMEARVAEEQKTVAEAQAAKDDAQKKLDALTAQQAAKPNADTERKVKDAEVEVMMANSKLSSANKSLERAQKKLEDSSAAEKPAVKIEKSTSEQKAPAVNEETKKAAEEQARKEAEAKAQKASEEAAKKAAEEQARKEADAKLAAQKASEEAAAKKAAEEAAAAAKKQALAAELGIDLNKCMALPNAPTKPSSELNPAEQAYAQGFLKQVNQIVAKKTADDAPPVSPSPVLEGSKLSPCEPNQKQALKFGYMGNGQYRLETPVLAGEQVFTVKNVVQSLNRTIPESDNGEVYVFFLDGREGRTQLSAFKKSLLEAAPQ